MVGISLLTKEQHATFSQRHHPCPQLRALSFRVGRLCVYTRGVHIEIVVIAGGSTQCVIEEGVDGLLVDPDNPDDIARALIELLSDDKKRERMGAMGLDTTIAQFT